MRKITITDSDGVSYPGLLPSSWAEVPLSKYTALALAQREVPSSIEPTVHPFANPAGCQALATLLGLPSAEPLLADVSLMLVIYEAAPWLFAGPLPQAADDMDLDAFAYQDVTYRSAGNLEQSTGAQFEACLDFLAAHEANPLGAGPGLLAVLYTPAGQKQTAETVKAAAAAFESLPMSIAWPLLQNFLERSVPLVLNTRKFFALRLSVEKLLSALETTLLLSSGSGGCCSNMLRWCIKAWCKRARRALKLSSPRSAFTAPPLSSSATPMPTNHG